MTNDTRPAVLVFRSRLLEWSETFIAAQANALERYRPVYAGYRIVADGAAYMGSAEVVVMEERAISRALSEGLLKYTGHAPVRWMRALRRTNPVLMHAHFGFSARVPVGIARDLGVPLVITYHGADITIERTGRVDRIDRERAFSGASRIIAVSRFIADRLRAAGAPADKVVLHYIGVDTDRFRPPEPARREDDSILFVGRLVSKKGLIHLINAMRHIHAELPKTRLLVAGDGPLRPRLQAAAQGLNVKFLGVQTP
ncbi:MAG TPA: glycosyltransferase, partial [Thermoanaerobaculia bacterium]